jgi:hypothetical protein
VKSDSFRRGRNQIVQSIRVDRSLENGKRSLEVFLSMYGCANLMDKGDAHRHRATIRARRTTANRA